MTKKNKKKTKAEKSKQSKRHKYKYIYFIVNVCCDFIIFSLSFSVFLLIHVPYMEHPLRAHIIMKFGEINEFKLIFINKKKNSLEKQTTEIKYDWNF